MPTVTITRRKTIECSDRALLIAQALHAYNNYPGSPLSAAHWPPSTDSALMKYILMGSHVENALIEAEYLRTG